MNYSKKQLQPLIDKFQINPETNTLFISVLEMFDNQPNYQFWAVKMIFGKIITIDELKVIQEWAEKNKTMIKNLAKKNIVAYSSKSDFAQLKVEMLGMDSINIVKNVISHFNTDQRKILTNAVLDTITPVNASANGTFMLRAQMFEKFMRLPDFRKQNFFTKCSGIRNAHTILDLMRESLDETYEWDKEDMLVFLENNCPDCSIIFNQGPYVIVEVPTFKDAKKLCGGGRTEWCLTMEQHHFDDYVSHDSKQYFLFDFLRKETDPFAHIGFTIQKGRGIIYAQTCDNKSMLRDFNNGKEILNIHTALDKVGVKMNMFIKIPKNGKFQWNLESFKDFIGKNKDSYAVAYENNNRIVVNVLSMEAFQNIVGHTMINAENFDGFYCDDNKTYVILDFNLPDNDDNAVIGVFCMKDDFDALSIKRVDNLFGKDIMNTNYLSSIGIKPKTFVGNEQLAPEIMIHKLISDNDEEGAVKFIEEVGKDFDINADFRGKTPIFSAISKKMLNLYKAIISHPKFDYSANDGYGETVLESLLYIYGGEEITTTNDEAKVIESLIKITLDCSSFDFNVTDINDDTAISIACEFPNITWVVEKLANNLSVDVNKVNAFDLTPLETALENRNFVAANYLLKRPDIVIREKTIELARKVGFDISQPTNSFVAAMCASV